MIIESILALIIGLIGAGYIDAAGEKWFYKHRELTACAALAWTALWWLPGLFRLWVFIVWGAP